MLLDFVKFSLDLAHTMMFLYKKRQACLFFSTRFAGPSSISSTFQVAEAIFSFISSTMSGFL